MFTNILVAIDTSQSSQAAFTYARDLAKLTGATLTLVNVVDISKLLAVAGYETPYPADAIQIMRDDGKRVLDDALALCGPGIHVTSMTSEGDACEEILQIADSIHADLIVLGTHGRSGLPRLFLGSVAEGVLRRAHAPVLVVRG